jgi:hypothetical protein
MTVTPIDKLYAKLWNTRNMEYNAKKDIYLVWRDNVIFGHLKFIYFVLRFLYTALALGWYIFSDKYMISRKTVL